MDVYGVELGECLSGRQTENCSTVLTFDLLNDCWIQEIHTTSGCSVFWLNTPCFDIVPRTAWEKRVLNHCAVKGKMLMFLNVYALYF